MANNPTWIGKTLGGRYRIDDLLGQGGMSSVYKAFDPNLQRIVAIKLIHSHLASDPRFLSRFVEEATAVAKLRHPNIVQVFDFNHDDDLYYMVQELIPGETLQQRLRRLSNTGRRVPTADAIQYTVHIANAAGYAHRHGMVHRDIKPANIMIDVHDKATLMDFGIVKIIGGESHTATGAVVGTALYLSPEMIRGEVPDPRSDVYSLGVTLFEMVSGKPPYESDSAMTLMMMHLNDPIPDLRQIRQDVPESLVQVIEKAMQKENAARYPSMEQMVSDLERALRELPGAPQVTQVEDTPPFPETVPPTEVQPKPEPPPKRTPEPQVPVVETSPHVESTPDQQVTFEGGTLAAKPPSAEVGTGLSTGQEEGTIPPPVGTTGGADQPPPKVPSASPLPGPGKRPIPLVVWIGVGAVAVILVVVGIYFASRRGGGAAPEAGGLPSATLTTEAQAQIPATNTPTVTNPPPPTLTPSLTPTETPTSTPTLGLPPTPTFPAGVEFSFIKDITLGENGEYLVDYDTLEFQEQLPGMHVHFFFNTVPPEQAGNPGSGPWILWGGPRPFDRYRQQDRPEHATQMCVRVANPDHSLLWLDSGNCMVLPDVNAVTVLVDPIACRAEPNSASQSITVLSLGDVAHVLGLSSDQTWWYVADPENTASRCWLPVDKTFFHGDWYAVPEVGNSP